MIGFRHTRFTIAVLLAAIVDTSSSAADQKQKPREVAIGEVPRAVLAAVHRKFAKAEIISARQLPYTPAMMDCDFWSLKTKDGKQELDIGVTGISGSYQVNCISKSIAIGDVPKPAIDALAEKYPQAKIESAREVLDGLMALPQGKTKPPDYQLSIVTGDRQSLIVCFTPEMKAAANGDVERNPAKMVFNWESPLEPEEK